MKIIFQESLHSCLGSLKSPSKSLIRVYHRSSSYSHERLIKVSSRSHKLAMHGWLEHSCYMAEQQQYFWVGHLRKISCFLCATMLSSSHSISKKEEDVSLFFFSLMWNIMCDPYYTPLLIVGAKYQLMRIQPLVK